MKLLKVLRPDTDRWPPTKAEWVFVLPVHEHSVVEARFLSVEMTMRGVRTAGYG